MGSIKRICEYCKKEFLANPSQIKWTGARFCSNQCKDMANRRRVEKTCEFCHKQFDVKLHKIKEGKGRFCSVDCFLKWRSANDPKGKDNKFYNQVTVNCIVCNKPFTVKGYRIKAGNVKFCSYKCRGEWRKTNYSGPNNPVWKPDRTSFIYPDTFNKQFKRMIRNRDGRICSLCGKPGIDVHHINYNKKDTTPENCITLCRVCHCITNGNREYWMEVLTDIRELQDRIYFEGV